MTTLRTPLLFDGERWIADAAIEIDEHGRVQSIENRDAPAGTMVIPGLPDLHSHAFQRALVGRTERRDPSAAAPPADSFWSWRERMYGHLERFGPDEVEAVALHLYVELLEAGYTSVAEFHYLHHDPSGAAYDDPAELSLRVIRAAERAGIRLTLLPVLYRHGGFGGSPATPGQRRFLLEVEEYLRLQEALGAQAGDRLRIGTAFHSLRAVTPGELDEVLDAAPPAPIHIHVAEQRREVEACLEWSGARPVQWLLDRAPVSRDWCLIHATHLDRDEVRALARSGAVAGLCPTTEANLGDGFFSLTDFLEAGGRIGVGSDSQVGRDPREELRWLEYGQRLRGEARNVTAAATGARSTGEALFRAALDGGAGALGAPVSGLRPGAPADLLVLDANHQDLAVREPEEILDGWIFGGGTSPIREVRVAGRVVVDQGRHPLRDEAREGFVRALRRLER